MSDHENAKSPRSLNLAQQHELLIAQRRLESGHYSFKQYHIHLTELVYTLD